MEENGTPVTRVLVHAPYGTEFVTRAETVEQAKGAYPPEHGFTGHTVVQGHDVTQEERTRRLEEAGGEGL